MAADVTAPKQQIGIPFKPGQSGNPAGRPKGARSKLGEAFLQAMLADFTENGEAAIQTVRAERPDQYLKVIASILPKEMNLNVTDQLSEMTDDELADRARRLARDLAPLLGGVGSDQERVGGETRKAKPAGLH